MMKRNKKKYKKINIVINVVVLLLIFVFLLTYFKPSLLFSDTITSGGDTASHFYPAKYLKEQLLPHWKVTGWLQGNYAGMPLFQFYFPLPFLIMVWLSYLIPLTIAFKIVTVLGIFTLPVSVFLCFKFMKYKFPTPIIASILSLLFLFNEGNSMWGGNILSTLAGEFSYSLSLSLSILFIGLLYKGIQEKRHLILNSVLIFLIGLSHVYTLLLVIMVSSIFLFTNFRENIKYLAKLYLLGFSLLSVWLLPLITKIGFTTSYNVVWHIKSIWLIFPKIFLPVAIIAFAQVYLILKKDKTERIKTLYFALPLFASAILFFFASKIGLVDIRFIPFVQLFLVLLGAEVIGFFGAKLRGKWILPLILLLIVGMWINYNTTNAKPWIKWNYEGFEKKSTWNTFSSINEFLNNDVSDARVVYEHSMKHNRFGTTRAFESLPLFSGRSTLEGVYMQSSPTAPFVFYIQSEISKQKSCPFPTYSCSKTNINSGLKHLQMFNVKHIIAVSEEVKTELRDKARLVFNISNYEIFEIDETGYVSVPDYWPQIMESKNRDLISYLWFLKDEKVPIAIVNRIKQEDTKYFVENEKEITRKCNVVSNLKHEEINFRTDCVGLPHIIKVSYFPNWKVKGAENVYYVTPSFMLVFPTSKNVKLYYGNTFADVFGLLITLLGIVIVALSLVLRKNKKIIKRIHKRISWAGRLINFIDKKKTRALMLLIIIGALLVTVNLIKTDYERDILNKEIAVTTKRYTQCQNAGSLKDECYIEIAKLTNDRNLCVAKVSNKNKDKCFKEMAID